MKLSSAFTAILILISLNAQSQSLTRVEHTLRNGTAGEVAALISLDCPQNKVTKVKELSYFLKKPPTPTRISKNVSSHDVILLMISQLTEIPLSLKEKSKVKAIISYQNKDSKVYRYHILKLSDKELKEFSKKLKNWIIEKSHA